MSPHNEIKRVVIIAGELRETKTHPSLVSTHSRKQGTLRPPTVHGIIIIIIIARKGNREIRRLISSNPVNVDRGRIRLTYFSPHCYFADLGSLLFAQLNFDFRNVCTRLYLEVSGLAAWSDSCKWCSCIAIL